MGSNGDGRWFEGFLPRAQAHLRANVIGYLALFVALGGTTYAATGGNFILGQPNSASSRTSLSAPISDRALQVTNTSTSASATALGLNVASGQPPLKVNSDTRVANLNADKLDGLDSSAYARSSLFGSPGQSGTGNASDSSCFLSEVKLLAGSATPSNWTLADGRLLAINQNEGLYALLGTTYGGNGQTNFALPDLRAADPKGGGPAGVNYFICTAGAFP